MKKNIFKISFNFTFLLSLQIMISSIGIADNKNERNVNVGIMNYYFTNVNLNDAKVAMNSWGAELSKEYKKKTGITMNYNIFYYDDINDMIDMVKSKKLDMVIIAPHDYLLLDLKKYIFPFMIDKPDDRVTKVLLVNNNSNIRNLNDLKSKSITLEPGLEGVLSKNWINMLCQQNGINDYNSYFSSLEEGNSNSMLIMKLFFGKTDACITSLYNFKTNSDLNPQIKEKIRILYSIDKILDAVTCLRKDCKSIDSKIITEIAVNLNGNKSMKSMMELFKKGAVVPYNEDLLIQIAELLKYNKNNKVLKKSK